MERLVGNLTEGLADRGHDVTLFAPFLDLEPGVVTSAHWNTRRSSRAPTRPTMTCSTCCPAYLSADQFDVIHDHTTCRVGRALGAMLGGRPPVVHTLHMPWTPVRQRFLGRVDDRIHIVASSRSQAGLNPGIRYAAMIYDGIDLDAHPLGDDKEGSMFIFVGRCCWRRGPTSLSTSPGPPVRRS